MIHSVWLMRATNLVKSGVANGSPCINNVACLLKWTGCVGGLLPPIPGHEGLLDLFSHGLPAWFVVAVVGWLVGCLLPCSSRLRCQYEIVVLCGVLDCY